MHMPASITPNHTTTGRVAGLWRCVSACLLAVLLHGCAVTHSVDSLAKPTRPGDHVTVQTFTYLIKDEDASSSMGLLAGDYVVEYEDSDGYYFRGPGLSVKLPAILNANRQEYPDHLFPGGVYVPRNTNDTSYRIYYYQHNMAPKTGQKRLDPAQEGQMLANVTPPNTPIVQGAVGGALGMALVEAMADSGRGQIVLTWGTSKLNIASFVTPQSSKQTVQ